MERGDSSLPKLTASSYQRWKFDMIAVLESKGLLEYVNGLVIKPELSSSNHEAVKKWTMEDAKAKSLISITLDDEHHILIRSCSSSKEMWENIVNYREQSSATNKFLCHQQFYEHCFRPEDSISSYLSELNGIVKKLKDLGTELAEETVTAKVINDLPKEYESFRTSWRLGAVGGLKLSFKDLQAQLLVAETGIRGQDCNQAKAGEALVVKKKEFKRTSKAECWSCGKKGHLRRDCRAKKSALSSNKPSNLSNNVGLMASDISLGPDNWILDSGASSHMSSKREWFSDYTELDCPIGLTIGNGKKIQAIGRGTIKVEIFNGMKWSESFLSSVLYVPELGPFNLFSLGAVIDKGYSLKCDGSTASIHHRSDNDVVLIGKRFNDEKIYRLAMKVKMSSDELACLAKLDNLRIIHERLGHFNIQSISDMIKAKLLPYSEAILKESSSFFCEACAYGKMHKLPARTSELRKCEVGEIVHADIIGPMECSSLSGSRFALVMKDELTAFRTVYFLKNKSQVIDMVEKYLQTVKEETGKAVKRFRSDNGTEFVNYSMNKLFQSHQIKHELAAPYTPEQNGMAERENRTMIEMARTMLQSNQLPKFLWAEAMNTASYLMNRVINRKMSSTPFELWFGKPPEYDHLRVFGCNAYVLVPNPFRKKWDAKAEKMTFVGYTETTKNYRLYDSCRKRVIIAKHVKFDETLVSSNRAQSQRSVETRERVSLADLESEGEGTVSTRAESPILLREVNEDPERQVNDISNITRISNASKRYDLRDRAHLPVPRYLLMSIADEPNTYEEALNSTEREKWLQAMAEEMSSLQENKVFELTFLPASKCAIKNRWVFRIKQNPDGSVDRFKARLVAKGFTQQPGTDFNETFSPVVRYDSVRLILSIASVYKMKIKQFDVTTAFLYGELDEELYMEQPTGFEDGTNRVCRLLKGLYGLKQAPRQWNVKFHDCLKQLGLKRCESDHCIYFAREGNELTILALYVDDGLVCSTDLCIIDRIVSSLTEKFKIKFGEVDLFVGMEIINDHRGIKIHQTSYINRLLTKFGMQDCKAVSTPGSSQLKLISNSSSDLSLPYRELIGALMFLTSVSRPDIAFEVSRAAQFMSCFNEDHWIAAKRILRYLRGTISVGIMFSPDKLDLQAYADADYASNVETTGLPKFKCQN